MITSFDFDAAVVGAGAVGLAVARALAARGDAVVILEKEGGIGRGVSSRNSEVVHAGLYYPTGSLRARLCVDGRRQLYPFMEAHRVGHAKCGKLIVAAVESEIVRLEAVYEQAERNDVEGVAWLTKAQAIALEPELSCVGALLSPETGIMDSHGFMLALQGEIEDLGGAFAFCAPFEGAEPLPTGGFRVRAGGAAPVQFSARALIVASGLGAQACAELIEDCPREAIPSQHLGKGVYFRLDGGAPFHRLVYPPPIPGALGTHFTRDLSGQGRFGPDLAYIETESYDVDPKRAESFYTAIRRYWPRLPDGALAPDYAGIRPKLHGPGESQPDFRIDGVERHSLPGLVTLFGIESPGLTSSLAIGDHVAGLLADQAG